MKAISLKMCLVNRIKDNIKMKKSIFFSLLATLSLGMASCSTDSNIDGQTSSQEGEMKTYTMVGGYDDANSATRMILTDGRTAFKWESTDVVHIWNSAGTQLTTANPKNISADGKSATFTFTTSGTPYSVTFGTSNITSDGKNLTLDATKAYSYASTAQYKNGANPLPIMAWALITSTTNNQLAFTLKHKISYIWFKSMTQSISGYATSIQVSEYTKATMNPVNGNITAVTSTSYTTTTPIASNPTGYMIPFIPVTNTATSGTALTPTPANDFIVKFGGATIINKLLFKNTLADNMVYPLTRTYKGSSTDIYWQWDAFETFGTTDTGTWTLNTYGTYDYNDTGSWAAGSSTYNPLRRADNLDTTPEVYASASCKYCPTVAEALVIIANGWYWDSTNKGAWFKKYTKCTQSTTTTVFTSIAPTGTVTSSPGSDYFFLPAYGYKNKKTDNSALVLTNNGTNGYYWLRNANSGQLVGSCLTFSSTEAVVNTMKRGNLIPYYRWYGYTLWDAQ
jgi:hypothetical protein